MDESSAEEQARHDKHERDRLGTFQAEFTLYRHDFNEACVALLEELAAKEMERVSCDKRAALGVVLSSLIINQAAEELGEDLVSDVLWRYPLEPLLSRKVPEARSPDL